MAYSLPFKPGSSVIELGGGSQPMFHPNADIRKASGVDHVVDLSKPLPFPSAGYDGVFSKYALEHVSWRAMPSLVKEACRLLKPGGTAVFVIPNTKAQMKWALEQPEEAYDKVAQCLFGDLDYDENSHKAAFSPAYARRVFREAGFSDVATLPHGELGTDMIVEARKSMDQNVEATLRPPVVLGPDPSRWSPEERKKAYDRHYFDGGRGGVGGYAREGYRDFPIHWYTFRRIMELKPGSVLEIGCAKGFILKRLQDAGIRAEGLEVSHHCHLTRACSGVREWDVTKTPWPFKDQEFDLAFSIAFLEHVPESAVDRVASEIKRITKRGLHGVDFGTHDDGFDKTHCKFRDQKWWSHKLNGFATAAGSMEQQVVDKEDLERGPAIPPGSDGLIKLNLGSNRVMYHFGWVNVDVASLEEFAQSNGYIYRRHDLLKGIPWEPSSVDMISASHFMEHFPYEKGLEILRGCHEVLKPGGAIRIAVPDARKLCTMYVQGALGDLDEVSDGCAGTPFQARKLWETLMSGHRSIYDAPLLVQLLKDAGFQNAEESKFGESKFQKIQKETIDMFPDLSIYAEATKA